VKRLACLVVFVAACGDNQHIGPLVYTPVDGGKLRLDRDDASTGTKLVLDLVVGNQPLTGYSAGFDLSLDASKVTLASSSAADGGFDLGPPPLAFGVTIGSSGPLTNELVVAVSQKATQSPTDKMLPMGTKLLSFELDAVEPLSAGVVFDGSTGVPSAGMRDRAGNTVVDTADVAIGKLEVIP